MSTCTAELMLESVGRLGSYDTDVEVCKTAYQSEYSLWSDSIGVWGGGIK